MEMQTKEICLNREKMCEQMIEKYSAIVDANRIEKFHESSVRRV